MTRIAIIAALALGIPAGAAAQQQAPPPPKSRDSVVLLRPPSSPPPATVAPATRGVAPLAAPAVAAARPAATEPVRVSAPVDSVRPGLKGLKVSPVAPDSATMRCKDGTYLTGTPAAARCDQRGGLAAILPAAQARPVRPPR